MESGAENETEIGERVIGSQAEATVLGKISKTFGAGGELVITLYDTFPYDNPEGECVFVNIDNIATPLFFGSFRRMGKNKAVVVFDDFDNEYRAMELIGIQFFGFFEDDSEDDAQDDDGELYLEDLEGFTVKFEGDARTARITGFIDDDFNPLFEMELDGAEIMVPAADDFIIEINSDTRTLRMKIPDGLLDL